ncbi:MAG: response regulator [Saprospiraceae bacterium]|nr:response regulator [Saprospiraceae bacterium]
MTFTRTTLDSKAITLQDGSRIIREYNANIASVLYPDYDFNGDLHISQANEMLWLPDGSKVLLQYYDKKLYDATQNVTNQTTLVHALLPVRAEIPDPASTARMVDKFGNLWVGSAGNGLYKIQLYKGFEMAAQGNTFYNMAVLPGNKIWQGSFGNRQVLNTETKKMEAAPWKPQLKPYQEVCGVWYSKKSQTSYLLTKTASEDVMVLHAYNHINGKMTPLPLSLPYFEAPPMAEDIYGNIWILSKRGEAGRYNMITQKVGRYAFGNQFPTEKLGQLLPQNLISTENGDLWAAVNIGVVQIQHGNGDPHFRVWHNYTKKGILFDHKGISYVYPDPEENAVWIGSQGGGLGRFDLKSEATVYFIQESGPFYEAGTIIPDKQGNLWISSEKGLSCFQKSTGRFLNYDFKTLFAGYEFNPTSCLATDADALSFGTWDGLLTIHPKELLGQQKKGNIILADWKINGKSPDETGEYLTLASDEGPNLRIKYHENNLFLRFVAPGSKNPENATFEYQVEGLSDMWIPTTAAGIVNLSGLPPGSYDLFVRHTGNSLDQEDQEQFKLHIFVRAPWYTSKVAQIIYILLILFVAFQFTQYNKKQTESKHQAELATKEMERLQFVDRFRKRFTAYLAHEFKAPLTIILGVTEMMKLNAKKDSPGIEYLKSIQEESNEMLDLVSEMMDIMKLEEGNLKLHFELAEYNSFLKNAIQGYTNLASLKNIKLSLILPEEPIDICMDLMRTKFIINNLLTNALRFTPEGGSIKIQVSKAESDTVRTTISDTGYGIPADKLPYIFDRYFQVSQEDSGNRYFGLGLAFVKELSVACGGNVSVESIVNKGTAFTLDLPQNAHCESMSSQENLSTKEEIIILNESEARQFESIENDNPLLLICDDNPTILSYLEVFLQNRYTILKASNGEEGLALAIEHLPDLILTDVVMPLMNGLELTGKIKKNPLTSHIPVVILSGKDESEARISGQLAGADAYLTKPFHYQELILTLQNLYSLQQVWKERYSRIIENATTPNREERPEDNSDASDELMNAEGIRSTDQFIEELFNAFEQNYHNDSFDTHQLCRQLFISRTQLYRKLASISDESPMEMLRNYRLQKASELLLQFPDTIIQDIAVKAGFKERTHFNAIFQKKFGMTPSEWRRLKLADEENADTE